MSSDSVLIFGASGWVGGQVAEAVIARGLPVRLALRGGEANKKAASFKGRAEVVSADLHDLSSLTRAVHRIETIVSVVQGGYKELVEGQVALARAGLEAGVKRILPSDFAVEFRGITTERHLFLGWRAEADRQIADLGLPQANILNGTFMEILGFPFFDMIDVQSAQIRFYGDADQQYEFTATKDVAEFTAEVVKDRERVGPQMVVTERASAREIAEIASAAFGRPFTLNRLGGLSELETELANRQAAKPDDPMAWIALQYKRLMMTGEGKLALPVSSAFITEPLRLREFLKSMASKQDTRGVSSGVK